MIENVLLEIKNHAERCAPFECCGLLIKAGSEITYQPCINALNDLGVFEISSDDWVSAEDSGEIKMVVHSHVGISPNPSPHDTIGCNLSGLPWFIYSHPSGDFLTIYPEKASVELVGLDYAWGVQDCATLVEKYYKQTLDINFPAYQRYGKEFWKRGECLSDKYKEIGFAVVPQDTEVNTHDVLLIQINSDTANHSAVYIGDGQILHHCEKQLSRKAFYGESWIKNTLFVMRHNSLC